MESMVPRMDVIQLLLNPEFYIKMIEWLGPFGFLAGVLLAMVEAFFPPLPLAAFVTINVITFGFLKGYLFSYIGTVVGAYCMFLLFGRYGRKYIQAYTAKHQKAQSALTWIHDKGILPIIVLMTFPFTPSVVLSGLAAFAKIRKKDYLIALIFGKAFMVFSLSFIGVNIKSFFVQPIKSLAYIILTMSISLFAKKIMDIYEKKVLRHRIQEQKINKILYASEVEQDAA